MSSAIGDLVDRAAKARGWGDQRVAFEIGVLPSEKVFNATQVKRLRSGDRQKLSRELVERLIVVLGLDRADAWEAALESADLKPPGLTADMLRKLELVATSANGVMPGKVALLPVDDGLDDQIRRLRPPRPQVDRRQRDRRRLHIVPEKVVPEKVIPEKEAA